MTNRTAGSETDDRLSRRQVLEGVALVAAPACCFTKTVPATSLRFDGNVLRIALTEESGLRKPGSARAVVDIGRQINMIVVHESRGRFFALDRSCTHGGAQCAYNRSRGTLQCTSLNHAEYTLQGVLLHGRTHGNLRTYEVRLDGAQIAIRLEDPT